ncbi:hypothetical protein [Streptomyces sp. NPDC007369]|uniref:hypothetical protein n=1 Tax=Streptomyces sp. NPDC007369 TaxID=3154589 RepID=UPI0033C3B9DE
MSPPLQTTLRAERAATHNRVVGRPIATLPPTRRIPFVIDEGHQLFSSELRKVYEFRVESDGPFGRVDPLTVEALSRQIQRAVKRQNPERGADVGGLSSVESAVQQIPVEPLGDGDALM